MVVVRLTFLAALAWCAYMTFGNAYWWAILRIPHRDQVAAAIHPRSSIWSPPPLPAYDVFRDVLIDLPRLPPEGTSITRSLRWEPTLIDGSLYLWGLTFVTTLFYQFIKIWHGDFLFHLVEKVAFGMTIAPRRRIGQTTGSLFSDRSGT
jgi:hypothetical protein